MGQYSCRPSGVCLGREKKQQLAPWAAGEVCRAAWPATGGRVLHHTSDGESKPSWHSTTEKGFWHCNSANNSPIWLKWYKTKIKETASLNSSLLSREATSREAQGHKFSCQDTAALQQVTRPMPLAALTITHEDRCHTNSSKGVTTPKGAEDKQAEWAPLAASPRPEERGDSRRQTWRPGTPRTVRADSGARAVGNVGQPPQHSPGGKTL